jgi:hypothetical protein
LGDPVELQGALVHPVGAQALALRREAARDAHLGHAERREGTGGVEAEALAGVEEPTERGGVDRLGTVEQDPHLGQLEGLLAAAQRPRGECVREVGSRGGRSLEVGHPAHPAQRPGEEVLRRTLHEVEPERHGYGEQADQPHVVVQREP